ncbi:magnesium transporter NIPA-domain-containing protein [Stachybotrys elegans]|uniref:Magnesium transporter NIPA-domain-containing protein n=1 Tax=Stachybotrys elegans TaxID=80388 RepID=A0A8K0SHG2_9HYPO|nr:magnesium transporter NIPA-domain-containing protein [Stachybotrys elegans]
MMQPSTVLTPSAWPTGTHGSWTPTPSPPFEGHHHDKGHNKPGETLQEWSSLIGIVTAIVGNVLIALALNVQRYAHTRLHKERIRIRQRANAALKRSQSGRAATYGSVNGAPGGANGHINGNGPIAASDHAHEANDDDDEADETAPLIASLRPEESAGTDPERGDAGDEDDNETSPSTYLKSPYWWLGQILITLGEMGNFLAYGFAPASIVSPLGVVALISNCIIAPAMFHEVFRPRDFWGVVIAVGGVVTVVLSANTEETKLEPHDVWDHITTMEFEIYLGVTIFLIMVLMWASPRYGRRTILIDLGLVGLFGGYTALSTKGVSSMLSSTLWRAFTTPVTYVLILILLATAIMQIRYVNRALQRFDSTQVIPIQFVMFTLCVIIGSAVLYRDFEKTTSKQAAKFVGGCLLTFFGVFLITSGRQKADDDDEDMLSDAEGIEETIGLARQESHTGHDAPTPVTPSRRSSRVSKAGFAEALRANTSRLELDTNQLRGPAASSPQPSTRPEATPIFNFNWQGSWNSLPDNAQDPRTLSVDSEAVASPATMTPAHSYPVTPMRDGQTQFLNPAETPVTPRQGTTRSRRSRTFISPSPFSSTVTTVVKDAVLGAKEGSQIGMSSLRRIRSSIRASLYFNDDDSITDHPLVPGSEDNLINDVAASGASTHDDLTRRRARSLSDTLGDLFRSKRNRTKGAFSGNVEENTEEEVTRPLIDDEHTQSRLDQ